MEYVSFLQSSQVAIFSTNYHPELTAGFVCMVQALIRFSNALKIIALSFIHLFIHYQNKTENM